MDGGAGTGHRILHGVHRRKATKKTKHPNKKKPIKVVYISNPMKVQTSASKFMALVQELTGQDADFPDPSKFLPTTAVTAPDNTASGGGDDDVGNNLMMDNYNNSPSSSSLGAELPAEDNFNYLVGSFFDDFDDLIFPPPPPLIGNFSGLIPAAAIYESYAR